MPRGAVANIRRSRAPFAAPAGGLTPPTVRDRTSYASAATETSAAVPIPASAQAGDVHYIFCELTASAGAITTPTGYTAVVPQFDSESSTSAESACFRKDTTLSGGGGTVTISFSSGRFAAASLAVQDVDTSVFEDVAGASDNGPAAGTTSVDAPSLTPANAGTLLLTGHTGRTNTDITASYTKPTGMTTEEVDVGTNVAGASNASVEVCSLAVTNTNATGVQTATASNTVNASGMSVLVRGVAGAGSQSVTPASIRSSEALGAVTVTPGAATISPVGIASSEQLGAIAATSAFTVAPTGIPTNEAVGTVQATVITAVNPAGITSSERFGAVAVTSVATISPASIPSSEAVGTALAEQALTANGIAPGERFGAITVTQIISPTGIASSEQLGTSVTTLFIAPAGIASEQRVGIALIGQAIAAIGIASSERLGIATVTPGTATIAPAAIPSAEQHGTSLVAVAQPQTISPASITSAEAFGTTAVAQALAVTAIPSTERFGNATVTPGTVTISPAGIPSGQAFGFTTTTAFISPAGIRSTERFGNAALGLTVAPVGIPSAESSGSHAVVAGVVTISPVGIPSAEVVGAIIAEIILGEPITISYEATSYITSFEAVVDYAYDATASPSVSVPIGGS